MASDHRPCGRCGRSCKWKPRPHLTGPLCRDCRAVLNRAEVIQWTHRAIPEQVTG